MILLALPLLASLACAAPAAPPAPAPAPAPAVAASTASAYVPASPTTVYTADKLRDPFVAGGGPTVAAHPFTLADFSIHNLSLGGIMQDRAESFAVFSDLTYGYSLILKRGRLYDPKGKLIPGVTGKLDVKRKTATLETADQDVQVFRLGEEGEE